MTFTQGDKVKLNKRADSGRAILGQGKTSGGLSVTRDDHRIFIPEEQVLQVSEAEDLVLGDMDATPIPRIAAEVVNKDDLNERFSKVE